MEKKRKKGLKVWILRDRKQLSRNKNRIKDLKDAKNPDHKKTSSQTAVKPTKPTQPLSDSETSTVSGTTKPLACRVSLSGLTTSSLSLKLLPLTQ